jgi:hypothetical protein
MKKIVLATIICLVLVAAPLLLHGASLNHQFPKLANLFYRWHIEPSEVDQLARYDILIIDMEVQTYSPELLVQLRQKNPNIKLLVYLAPEEVRGDSGTLTGTLRQKFFNRVNSSWWLKNTSGQQVAWWAPNPMINVTKDCPTVNGQKWYDVLPWFVKNELIDTGYWDGVFYDNVWDDIGFMSGHDIDLNNDGQAESVPVLNQKWREGMSILLSNTRNVLGNEAIIMGNGGEYYFKYVNGTLYETFPVKGWAETLTKYDFITRNGFEPAIGVLNTNVENTGQQNNYKKMRYGLASSLMANGYYGFDNGDQSHHEMWWYDEYETSLGEPAGEPFNVLNNSTRLDEGLWRRDFANGLALVNSTNKEYRIDLGGEYEKIHGTQDTWVNDGSFVSRVTIPAKDGLILLRPVEDIYDATFVNGSFARVFNEFGNVSRAGFFAYNNLHQGGNQIIQQDINHDGKREVVTANVNEVKIYNYKGEKTTSFYPYTERYRGGINITVGDLDNNGTLEIITGTENGGGPQVRIFNHLGKLINPGFFAYAESFRGGVNVAVGDLEGDGQLEIIAGAGVTGGPHVRVFAADGRLINPGFFAYDEAFRGGVNVACGDVDGDGIDEIVTGPGKGGGPQVKVYNKEGIMEGEHFFAFEQGLRDGVEVVTADMDEDGKDEIIATTSDVFTLMGL